MRKLFGIEAEVNITADEDIIKGLGKGVSKLGVNMKDILKDIAPELKETLKKLIDNEKRTNN